MNPFASGSEFADGANRRRLLRVYRNARQRARFKISRARQRDRDIRIRLNAKPIKLADHGAPRDSVPENPRNVSAGISFHAPRRHSLNGLFVPDVTHSNLPR